MNKMLVTNGWDRRAFLAASGALVVAAGASGLYSKSALAEVSETRPPFTPDQLDSWLSIDKAGNVTAYFGKIDVGQGVDVSVSQIIAEELDVALQSVKIIMGNSDLTIDHGDDGRQRRPRGRRADAVDSGRSPTSVAGDGKQAARR